jgi:cytochrome P450
VGQDGGQGDQEVGQVGAQVAGFALPLPSLVICELLGVARADQATFQSFAAAMTRLDTSPEEVARLGTQFDDFLTRLVERIRLDTWARAATASTVVRSYPSVTNKVSAASRMAVFLPSDRRRRPGV